MVNVANTESVKQTENNKDNDEYVYVANATGQNYRVKKSEVDSFIEKMNAKDKANN